MAQTFVQLPDDSANTGKKEDHWGLPGGNVREVVTIGGTTDAALAPVSATNGLAVDAKTLAPDAATATKQDTGNTALAAIDGIVSDVWDSVGHTLKTSIQNTPAVTVSGAISSVTTITNVVHVDDNGGSLTVDGTVSATFPTATSASLTNVSSSATNVTLIASNASRKMATIVNDSTATLYVKFGATATTTSYTYKMFPGATLELPIPVYTGIIDGIWDSANGAARTTEW